MEQRLIDAKKIVYSWTVDADGTEHDGVTLQSIINKLPTVNAIVIPEGATNGDMIKAMFPNLKIEEQIKEEPRFVKIFPYNDDCFLYFTKELWNSPYKRGE